MPAIYEMFNQDQSYMPNEIVTTTTSKQFTLNLRDALRGAIMAAIGAGLALLLQLLQDNPGGINWARVGIVSAIAGISYLLKNLFEPSKTIISPPPDTKSVRVDIPKPGQTTKQQIG